MNKKRDKINKNTNNKIRIKINKKNNRVNKNNNYKKRV